MSACAAASPAAARDLTVWPGQSIREALHRARPGDTVLVRAGTYFESLLYIPSGIRLISADGPGQARIDGGGHLDLLGIYNRKEITIDGFDLYHAGGHLIKIEGSSDITIRNCKIHDTIEGDCVKVTVGSRRITVEECEIYNPGSHGDGHEQNVDFIDTEEAVVRRCLLYHVNGAGHQIGYFKGGSRRCVFDNNVVLNAGGDGGDAAAWTLGQQTDAEYKNGDYECVDSVVRDNVFINCRNGAIGFYGCKGAYAYGNVILNSPVPFGFHRSGNSVSPAVDEVFVHGNAVLNPRGDLKYLFEGRQNLDGHLAQDYNLVWNGGKSITKEFKDEHGVRERPAGLPEGAPEPAEGLGPILARYAGLAPGGADVARLLPPAAMAPPRLARGRVPDPTSIAPAAAALLPEPPLAGAMPDASTPAFERRDMKPEARRAVNPVTSRAAVSRALRSGTSRGRVARRPKVQHPPAKANRSAAARRPAHPSATGARSATGSRK